MQSTLPMRIASLAKNGAVLLLALHLGAPAKADETVASFRAAAKEIPNALVRKGYRDFGRLNLGELLRSIDQADVSSSAFFHRPEPVIEGFDTARSGAEWKREGGQTSIRVNRQLWTRWSRPVRSVLALHEHLGPAQFADHNYHLSTALWLLSLPESDRALNEKERADLVGQIVIAARSGNGGITGVGGGGDGAGVSERLGLLKRDLSLLGRAKDDSSRAARLSALYADFGISQEVRWNESGMKDVEIRVTPADRSQEAGLYRACTDLLGGTPTLQKKVYEYVRDNIPGAKEKWANQKALVRSCRASLREGS